MKENSSSSEILFLRSHSAREMWDKFSAPNFAFLGFLQVTASSTYFNNDESSVVVSIAAFLSRLSENRTLSYALSPLTSLQLSPPVRRTMGQSKLGEHMTVSHMSSLIGLELIEKLMELQCKKFKFCVLLPIVDHI